GVHHDPVFVSRVVDTDGKVVLDETGRSGTRALDPDVARCEVSILHGPIDYGTAAGKGIPGYDAFGKTGTNDRHFSSAFLGGTENPISFIWHRLPRPAVSAAARPNPTRPASITPAHHGPPDTPFPPPGPACDAPGVFTDPLAGRTDQPVAAPTTAPAPTPAPAPQPAPAPAPAPAPRPAPPPVVTQPPPTQPPPTPPATTAAPRGSP